MFSPWRAEILWAIGILVPASIVGALTDSTAAVLVLLLLVFLAMQIRQVTRLERWLRAGGMGKYPKSFGIWEEIYYHLYKIKRRDKRRKKRLGKMLDRFRKSTAAWPDAAVVLEAHDEIDWFNKAATRVLGLKKGDIGQRVPNLVRHPDFITYLRHGDYRGSVSIPSPIDDKMVLDIRVVPYGKGLRLLLAQDVTEFRRMERMRSDFVANVSHELRTPITVLKGYLETLRDGGEMQSAPFTASLMQMSEQADRMHHLVDDLLLLTRLETRPRRRHEVIDVPGLLQRICDECNALAPVEPRVELIVESRMGLLGDEQELRSAFTNVIVNALKYSPPDSKVSVTWKELGGGIQLRVVDRGDGISPEHIPRITERFYRVDSNRSRQQGGTGLGLAIVKHVLTRHRGELNVTSQLGKGSCFSCCFPADIVRDLPSLLDVKRRANQQG